MSFVITAKRGGVAVCFVAILGASSPAVAHESSRTGVRVWTTNSDKTLHVRDTAPDKNDVYGRMTRQGVSGIPTLRNSNGYKSEAVRDYSEKILSVQACVDDFGGDTCAPWD
jgi:hypothetical protein